MNLPHAPVLDKMQAQIAVWETLADRRATFLSCYRLMTGNMLAGLHAGRFHDAAWVEHLLNRFADYYFDALTAYERDPLTAPPVWQLAHQACRQPGTLTVQNLLLGVNAHINYDLVLVLVELLEREWPGLAPTARATRYADHCQVNIIIAETIDTVQDTVIEPVSPGMDVVDKAFGPIDEWLMSRLITHWREEVWQHSVRWLEAPTPAAQTAVRHAMEQHAVHRAEVLLGQHGPFGLMALA